MFEINPSMRIEGLEANNENVGYLRKFWVKHPQLGLSLIKIEEETAPTWTEKIAYELAIKLDIPAAQYELGKLVGWQKYPNNTKVIVSPTFKAHDLVYVQGEQLLEQYHSITPLH